MLRRFFWLGALAGVLLPLGLLARWKLFGHEFGLFETVTWPASILLMAVSSWSDPFSSLLLAVAILLNALLYALVGALMCAVIAGVNRLIPAGRAEP